MTVARPSRARSTNTAGRAASGGGGLVSSDKPNEYAIPFVAAFAASAFGLLSWALKRALKRKKFKGKKLQQETRIAIPVEVEAADALSEEP